MGAGHVHRDDSRTRSKTRLLSIALVLTGIYMVVEAVGGWLTNSLALLADAGHMLTDVAAIARRIRDAGGAITREPTPVPEFNDAIIGFAKDLDGYTLELLQRK